MAYPLCTTVPIAGYYAPVSDDHRPGAYGGWTGGERDLLRCPVMDQTPTSRLTVSEAAGVLGISVEAVRGRVKRRTIAHERDGDRVYVILDADQMATGHDQSNDQPNDQTLMVARLEDEVEFLRDQVRRQQEIIAQQAVTMRQLSAPPESTVVDQEGEEPPAEAGGPQNQSSRAWWRFWR